MKDLNLQFRNDYFDDPVLKDAFYSYVKKIFGLDFSKAHEKGIVNRNYIAFSAFNGDECIASIAVYIERILIQGTFYNGAHLLAVGTLPEYQRKGIQKRLWEQVKDYADNNGINHFYLSTNYDGAINFYHKLGFERQFEHAHIVEFSSPSNIHNKTNRKLNVAIDEDWELLKKLASHRSAVSERLFIDNIGLFLFSCLYIFYDDVYYVEEIDSIIIHRQCGNKLVVYDVIAVSVPQHETLLKYLPLKQIQFIEYRFYTDKLNIGNIGRRFIDDNPLMVDKTFPLRDDVIFPFIMYA